MSSYYCRCGVYTADSPLRGAASVYEGIPAGGGLPKMVCTDGFETGASAWPEKTRAVLRDPTICEMPRIAALCIISMVPGF